MSVYKCPQCAGRNGAHKMDCHNRNRAWTEDVVRDIASLRAEVARLRECHADNVRELHRADTMVGELRSDVERLRRLALRWEAVASYLGVSISPDEESPGAVAIFDIGEWKDRAAKAESEVARLREDRDELKSMWDTEAKKSADLRAQRDALRAVVGDIQWCRVIQVAGKGATGQFTCPVCGETVWDGHSEDCALRAALEGK